jgi:TPP-dependent pyruvate/acetoin dehydrogenase alpha subunit
MGEPGVAVVFFGEGATGEGVFHESMNMAALWQLPVLFVCENNQYAMSSAHRDFSPVAEVATRAAAYDMAVDQIDGNDVVAVCQTVANRRAAITESPEPVLIELETYRLSGHSRGDQRVYRSRDEEADAWQGDPLVRARTQLTAAAVWGDAEEAALAAEIAERLVQVEAVAREAVGAGEG